MGGQSVMRAFSWKESDFFFSNYLGLCTLRALADWPGHFPPSTFMIPVDVYEIVPPVHV